MTKRRVFDLNALKQQFAGPSNNQNNGGGNYYLFWDMDINKQATVRFLPDKDFDNPNFLIEKQYHELIIDGEKRKIPCLKQYDKKEKCPICEESQRYYNEEGDNSVTGRQLYRKKQWIGQVLVVNDPLPANAETGTNSQGDVRLVTLSSKIYKVIKDSIDNDLDAPPHCYENGTNFIIKKTMDGKYADYSLSKFDRKSTPVDESIIDDLEEKLVDLNSLIPARPDREYIVKSLHEHFNGSTQEHEPEIEYKPSSKPVAAKSYDEDEDDEPVAAPKAAKPAPAPSEELDEDEEARLLLEKIKLRRSKVAAD